MIEGFVNLSGPERGLVRPKGLADLAKFHAYKGLRHL